MTQYEVAAEMAGVNWCRCAKGNHWENLGDGGIVHFIPRRETKRGLYDFLMLAYGARYGDRTHPAWRYYFRRAKWVQQMASDMHRRLPRSLFDEDRARIREGLTKEWLQDDEVLRARQWSRR